MGRAMIDRRMRRVLRSVLTLTVIAVAVAACGSSGSDSGAGPVFGPGDEPSPVAKKLFPEDFKVVCEGVPLSAAKPYDKAATGHKAVYLKSYKDSGLVDSSTNLPKDWIVSFDANADAYAAIDVVVCAQRTSVKLAENCDGYQVDDKPSPLVVKMHTARYTVTAHDPNTGKVLGKTTVAANDGACPLSVFGVEDGATTMNDYALPPDEKIAAFAKKFILP
jgi:hypothetical protein